MRATWRLRMASMKGGGVVKPDRSGGLLWLVVVLRAVRNGAYSVLALPQLPNGAYFCSLLVSVLASISAPIYSDAARSASLTRCMLPLVTARRPWPIRR